MGAGVIHCRQVVEFDGSRIGCIAGGFRIQRRERAVVGRRRLAVGRCT
jgi:hypothetical protein